MAPLIWRWLDADHRSFTKSDGRSPGERIFSPAPFDKLQPSELVVYAAANDVVVQWYAAGPIVGQRIVRGRHEIGVILQVRHRDIRAWPTNCR